MTLSNLQVNPDRLYSSIESLGEIGKLPEGGVQRLAFSEADRAGRAWIKDAFERAGLEVNIDSAGNIIGTYRGTEANLGSLATGSHIDTVPEGGIYDGAFGVLAGLEVVKVLSENNVRLRHGLEVIVFTDEESTMIGSKAMSGNIPPQYQVNSSPIEELLQTIGGNWQTIDQARRSKQEIAAFVELHVEQGPVLENLGIPIGVVQGIVGQQRYHLKVEGTPSHAGTTPMSMRQDALVAASQIVLAVNQIACRPGDQVATIGYLTVSPNAVNTIPGLVELKLDIRDLEDNHIDRMVTELRQKITTIEAETRTKISLHQVLHNQATPASPQMQGIISSVATQLGYSFTHLPSRASHDAQEIGRITDIAMIFVPSRGGISHAKVEHTTLEECAMGANVLLHTLIALDKIYD